MKKFIVLFLMIALVFSMGSMVMAASTEVVTDVDVNITITEYFDAWFDTPDHYQGLFGVGNSGEVPIGEAGIYISDGQATVNSALGIWNSAGATSAMVHGEFFNKGQLDNPQVEMFKVDANTMVDVTLSSTWDNWLNAPTLFRVSSSDSDDRINGFGNWNDDLAVIGNDVEPVNNSEYQAIVDAHNTAVNNDLNPTFTLDFGDELICNGPLEFHLNGALWLPKISQVAAGDYSTDVVITVAASETS